MKNKTTLYLSICVTVYSFLSGCTLEKKNENNLIQIDVSASYPEREIKLEDVADIEYLQLELDDDYLFAREPHIVTSNKIIISHSQSGDVLIFSRNGKPLSKFNRKGNGPGEYTYIRVLLYDEISDEIFIKSNDRIFVYSSLGEFKRMIPLSGRMEDVESQFVNYDSETFLLYHNNNLYPTPFTVISKKDGSVVDSINTPKGKAVTLFDFYEKGFLIFSPACYRIVKHHNGYLLTDFTIDTVYLFTRDKNLSPILVRKPKIQSMNPVIYLNSFIEAGNYEFVSAVTVKHENGRLPVKYLMRDKKTGSVYRQKITFNDYQGKIVHLSPETIAITQDSKLGLIVLELEELREANNANKLSGKLKELVENSDWEGNSIYLFLHFR